MSKNFRIFFTNFNYYSANESEDLNGAMKIAKKAGFQSSIVGPNGDTLATYCPIAGFRHWKNVG